MQRRRTLKPWLFGFLAGSLFVGVEALAGVYPPSAYGFCLTCHARDLAGTVVNALFDTNFQTAVVARRMLMITSPAVLLGAWVAARRSGEHRVLSSDRPVSFFALGFAVMTVDEDGQVLAVLFETDHWIAVEQFVSGNRHF